jgi:hypothetical protein
MVDPILHVAPPALPPGTCGPRSFAATTRAPRAYRVAIVGRPLTHDAWDDLLARCVAALSRGAGCDGIH